MIQSAMHKQWGRIAMAVAGACIYAIGINLFVVPAGLITGGMVGFCQLLRSAILGILGIKYLSFDLSGIIYYALNIPLLIIAYRSLGHRFFRNTIICTTAYTVFLSIVPVPAEPIVDDVLTACLLGGVISGVGTGIALTSGCCGGGLDIVGLYMSKKGAKVTVGQFSMVFNFVIFATCWVMYDTPTMIYSVINNIFHSVALDRAHRQSVTVQVLIFTKKDDGELDRYIIENLHRGITRWEGKGVYTGEDVHVFCACMNKYEIGDLKDALRKIDPAAFCIVQEGAPISHNFDRRLSAQ